MAEEYGGEGASLSLDSQSCRPGMKTAPWGLSATQGEGHICYRKATQGTQRSLGTQKVSEEVVVLNMTPRGGCQDKAKKGVFEVVEIECTRPGGKRESQHI